MTRHGVDAAVAVQLARDGELVQRQGRLLLDRVTTMRIRLLGGPGAAELYA
ncbi:MAG: hypothetical protein ACRDPB_09690 [Nocardioidaceae bacterium]